MTWSRRRWPLIGISGVLALVILLATIFTRQQADARPLSQSPGQLSFAAKFVCGYQRPIWQEGGEPPVKPGNYATEINIYNHNSVAVDVRKSILLLVKDTSVPGREPNYVTVSATDAITLPAGTATMDDCNRIYRLLNPGAAIPTPMPLMIGFLNLTTSGTDLTVKGVYTAGLPGPNTAGNPPTSVMIEVEDVVGKRVQ